MIERIAKEALLRLAAQFPVVGVTGPRQSGKTTLAKAAFPHKKYVSFDDRTMRELAASNPRDFIAAFPDGAIIDEAQIRPKGLLFRYAPRQRKMHNSVCVFIAGLRLYLEQSCRGKRRAFRKPHTLER